MKKTAALFTFFLLLSQAIAQPVDSLIQEAYKNNSQLKSFDYQIQAAGFRASSSRAWPAPTLGIELSQIPSNSSNMLTDAISNNISISQMFMLGGKLSAMSEMEKRKGRVLEQNRGAYEVQLRARIKMNYFQLWLLDRQIEVQMRSISLFNELVQNMQSHVMINRMRQADLFSIQAEVASEKSNLRELYSKRVNLQNEVHSLLGRNDFTQTITTDSTLPSTEFVLSENQLSDKIRLANPSLIAMDRMKEMNDAEITSANRELFPDVMLQAMVMRMPNGMILTGGQRSADAIQQIAMGMPMQKTDWMYSVMASMTLPFAPWSSERSTAKADEMRSTTMSIEAEKNAMEREMIASLRSALNRYATADSLVRQYQNEILPLTRQSAEAQTVAYQTGQVPITTVLDSRRMELMKQDDYLMVQMNRQMALVEIEMMVGTPLQ
ncbi:MAG: TolC family protein [Ignavibacteriae bacterium]|nr:MAG: TolC family protein [Ignavibacteriota bacterium]